MKRTKQIILSALFFAFLICDSLTEVMARQESKTLSPYFYIENADPTLDSMPLKTTSVDVHISGVIAEVTIMQLYENKGSKPINAKYVFPSSTSAAVHAMQMKIGERVIKAVVKEYQEAKEEYKKQ